MAIYTYAANRRRDDFTSALRLDDGSTLLLGGNADIGADDFAQLDPIVVLLPGVVEINTADFPFRLEEPGAIQGESFEQRLAGVEGQLLSVESERVQDEGVALPKRKHLNFVGAGVTATDDAGGDRSIVTIPGSGAASIPAFTSLAIVKRYKTLADRQAEQRRAVYFTDPWTDVAFARWTRASSNVGANSAGQLFAGSFVASSYYLQAPLPDYGEFLRMTFEVHIVHDTVFHQFGVGVHGEPQVTANGTAPPSKAELLFQQNSDTNGSFTANAPAGYAVNLTTLQPTSVPAGIYQGMIMVDREYVHLSVTPADGSWEGSWRIPLAKGGEGPVTLTAAAVGSGGTHTAGAKFWAITYVNNKGETSRSNEVTATTVLNDSVNLTWPTPPLGTTAVKVYRATAAGGHYGATQLVTTLAGTATAYTDTGTALTTGGAPMPRPKFIYLNPLDSRGLTGSSMGPLAVTGSRTKVPMLPAGVEDGGTKVLRSRTPTAMDSTRVSLPATWDPCGEVAPDLVVYLHGAGSGGPFSDGNVRPFVKAFNDAGYVVSDAIFGNSGVFGNDGSVVAAEGPSSGYFNWGSPSAMDYIASHIEYVLSITPINRIVLFGVSMGGIGALNTLARRRVPGIVGMIGLQPVCNLANMYAGSYQSSIKTVYGIASDGSDYAARTAGYDPNLKTAPQLRDLPTLLVASAGDTVVNKPANADALAAKLTTVTALTVTGDHGNASHFDSTIQAAAVAFAAVVFPAE